MRFLYIFLFVIFTSSFTYSQTWQLKLDGRSVWSLAKDNSGNIYAGGLTNTNSRIWRSTNAGNSWDTIYIGSGSTMWGFGFDQLGTIFVANYTAGLLKSTNNGANFTIIDNSNFGGNQPQNVVCGTNNYVYVCTPNGFYRSTNSGTSFTGSATLDGLNCLPVVIDKDSANIIYVGVSGGTSGQGFYRSTDYGVTFSSNLNPGKNGYGILQKQDGTLLMITTTNPFTIDRSTNKGLTWSALGNAPAAMRGITLDLAGNIYVGGNGGVFKSTNNGTSFTNFGLTGSTTPMLTYGNKILAGVSGATAGVYIYTDSTIVSVTNPNEGVPANYSLYQNYPNPFNPVTKIRFNVPVASLVSLRVYNILGKEVSVILHQQVKAGSYEVIFDASHLNSGLYYYKLDAGPFSETKKMLLVK